MALFGHRMCDLCSKNRAVIKYTRVDDDNVTELLICQNCATETSPLHKKADEGVGIQALFASLLKEKTGEEAGRVESTAVCNACGTSYETYRKTFLLGCSHCYESFSEPLMVDLRKIHGELRHLGKVPAGQAVEIREETTMTQLRHQLAEAIEREDYEAAAKLRDEIHEMQHRGLQLSDEDLTEL